MKSIWTCIHGELKEQSMERKMDHEEMESNKNK